MGRLDGYCFVTCLTICYSLRPIRLATGVKNSCWFTCTYSNRNGVLHNIKNRIYQISVRICMSKQFLSYCHLEFDNRLKQGGRGYALSRLFELFCLRVFRCIQIFYHGIHRFGWTIFATQGFLIRPTRITRSWLAKMLELSKIIILCCLLGVFSK